MFLAPMDNKVLAVYLELQKAKSTKQTTPTTTVPSLSPFGLPTTSEFLIKFANEKKTTEVAQAKARAATQKAAFSHRWAPRMPRETASAGPAAVVEIKDLASRQSTGSFFNMALYSAYAAQVLQNKAKAAATSQNDITKALAAASFFGMSMSSAARTTPPQAAETITAEETFELVEDVNAFVAVPSSAAKVHPDRRVSSSDSAFVVVTN